MRQHVVVLLCLALCAILCAPAFCADSEKPPQATVKGPGFHFTVALTRATYLEGEPVLAKCSITNDLKKSQKLVEPYDGWEIIRWNVVRLPGRGPAYHPDWYPQPYRARISSDCFWEFKPGETKFAYVDVRRQMDYNTPPPGEYAVKFKYVAEDHIQADWVGTLQISEMTFQIVAPQGIEAEALAAYKALRGGNDTKEELLAEVAVFARLSDPKRGGRYAPFMGYAAATALRAIDRGANIPALRKYVSVNRNIPYFGNDALRILGGDCLEAKDYAAARQIYQLLPEGYWRDYYLRGCDLWEARHSESAH